VTIPPTNIIFSAYLILFDRSVSDLSMGLSINHEVEFEGDVELGKIADDKPATPIWASKIMAAFEKAGKNGVLRRSITLL
jgi:hypothetical protein